MGPNGEAQYYARDLADGARDARRAPPLHLRGPRRARPALVSRPGPADARRDDVSVSRRARSRIRHRRRRSSTTRPIRAASGHSRCGPSCRRSSTRTAERSNAGARGSAPRPRSSGTRTSAACRSRSIGIESVNVPRNGYRPLDGPAVWSGGTLVPAFLEEDRAGAERRERQPAGGDPRQPLGLRRLARVAAQACSSSMARKSRAPSSASTGRSSSWSCRATTAGPTWCSRRR